METDQLMGQSRGGWKQGGVEGNTLYKRPPGRLCGGGADGLDLGGHLKY